MKTLHPSLPTLTINERKRELTQATRGEKHFTAGRVEHPAPVSWVRARPIQALATQKTPANHPLATASRALELKGSGHRCLRRRATGCRRRRVMHRSLNQSAVRFEDVHHLFGGNQLQLLGLMKSFTFLEVVEKLHLLSHSYVQASDYFGTGSRVL